MANNGYRWFIAGTMLGATGVYLGSTMMRGSQKNFKKARSKAASMAGKLSREAGDMLGMVGETLANRMR